LSVRKSSEIVPNYPNAAAIIFLASQSSRNRIIGNSERNCTPWLKFSTLKVGARWSSFSLSVVDHFQNQ
jgi:hypothetical protein